MYIREKRWECEEEDNDTKYNTAQRPVIGLKINAFRRIAKKDQRAW